MSDWTINVTDAPSEVELDPIIGGLTGANESSTGQLTDNRPLAVIVRDPAGVVVGGIQGQTHWGWLYVQRLWVDEGQRGQGLAGLMLQTAESEARARGCHGAWIDTFNPVALRVYERQGYEPFGELPEFPRGRTRTFLRKTL